MKRILGIRLDIDEYERLEKLAKASGKNISQYAREILQNGLRQELKDTQLLNRLIQKIESLSELQPSNPQNSKISEEVIINMIKHNTAAVIECLLALSSEFFFDRKKHENFEKVVREILKKILSE
ncbi:ribbon-helix-helix protein, CopG family [Thermodesulfovibrio sp.]|uniref:plasmid mobilization protein n=1 Tax=Thermodesulfovibrio sp. TaxID=2067987 RepID=UPI0030A3D1C1